VSIQCLVGTILTPYTAQSAGGKVDTIVDGPVPEVVKQVVVALLGEKALGDVKSEGLSGSVFDILTQVNYSLDTSSILSPV
jgi:hypothetical protein